LQASLLQQGSVRPLQCNLIEVSSDATKDLKVALIERNALQPSNLSGPPGNRCSSLTPGSVRFLQGDRLNSQADNRHWGMETHK
jgi:hypothetical protein